MALGNEPRFVTYGSDSLENLRVLPITDDGRAVPVAIVDDGLPDQTQVFSEDFALAGDVVVWTPAAGKRVVLTEYSIELTGNASAVIANATQLVTIKAGATVTDLRHVFFVPRMASNTPAAFTRGRTIKAGIMFGIDEAVAFNLSHPLATGRYYVTLIGYEV